MPNLKTLLVIFCCLFSTVCFADKYPRNYSLDMIHYKFELTLSDTTDMIIGRTSIDVLFKTGDQKQVRLDLANKTDKRNGKGMMVESVTWYGQALEFVHENDALIIKLPKAGEKGMVYTFVVTYKGIPADGLRIGATKYGDRSFFNENWPNRTRHWLPTVDHPYDKATSEFIVTAPAHYKVVSNGLLLEESMLNKDQKLTHWKQSVPVSSWLFVLGVCDFAVQYVDQFEGKSIQTWVYAKDREAGFFDFASPTKQVLEFYSAYVGPFAYEKLASIQTPSVNGGMETSSAIFYGQDLINGKRDIRLRNVVIHELAHQWFGNAVTESTWDDAWLSEGFATYFTLLFQEHAYGYEEYIDGLKRSRKTILDFYKKDSTFKIIDDRTAELAPVTNNMTYQKGAWTLHMLRDKMGHENFKKGIQAYYKKYFNANASTDDLLTEMQAFCKEDLHTFFDQWLKRPDVLKIRGSWEYDSTAKQVIINLEQTQSSGFLFDVPVEFQIIDNAGNASQLLKFNLKTKKAQYKMSAAQKPAALIIDPRTVLLGEFDLSH